MNQLSGYYSPSNKIEPGGFAKLLAYGLIGTLPFAAAAGYLTYFVGSNKIVLTEVVVGIALGVVVGLLVNKGAEVGKIRNKPLLTIAGFFFGLLGVYVASVFVALAASGHKELVLAPGTLAASFKYLASKFTLRPDGSGSSTELQHIVWGLEALAVLFFPTRRAFKFLEKKLFCENCNLWVAKKESLYPFPFLDGAEKRAIIQSLETGDFEVLRELKLNPLLMNNSDKYYSQVDVFYCSNCGQFYVLSITNWEITWVSTSHGHQQEVTKSYPVVKPLIIPQRVYKIIRGLDYTEKPLDVDAMINEISWTHRVKSKFLELIGW